MRFRLYTTVTSCKRIWAYQIACSYHLAHFNDRCCKYDL